MSGIESARERLARATRIVSFSGAGLSAESGIATFRNAQEDGLWSKSDPMRLASPQGFADDPETVIAWYNERRTSVATAEPNPAHIALATRNDIIHVTQNVDDLLERAGVHADTLIHLHGTIATDRCHAMCGHTEEIDLADPPPRRDCPQCGSPIRPGVVWFGESLPEDKWVRAEQACASCQVLLVVGTSAEVHPAAGLIGIARESGACIIVVNTEPSGASGYADVELIGPAGEIVPPLLERQLGDESLESSV